VESKEYLIISSICGKLSVQEPPIEGDSCTRQN
jgi:hypothetical protein